MVCRKLKIRSYFDMKRTKSSFCAQTWAFFLILVSVPKSIDIGILQCRAFSFSSVLRPMTPVPTQRLEELKKSQSKQDSLVSNWFVDEAGIVGISRICLSTTEKSVGGRGIFWVDNDIACQGDVLALIPAKCVITSSNLQDNFPALRGMQESDVSWPAKITALAMHCLQVNDNDYMNRVEWIKAWQGGGPSGPQPSEYYPTEELNQLAATAGSTVDLVEEAIDKRYETFMKDFKEMKKKKYHASNRLKAADFGAIYSIVVSRSACLGPIWGGKRGIIPLHDFLNHPPSSDKSNVELFCFGDLRKMVGYVHANELVRRVLNDPNEKKVSKKDGHFEPKDDDIVLVASRDIGIGDELWLSYRDSNKIDSVEERIWLMLQYGFPLHI